MSRTYLRRILALTTLLAAACSDTHRDEITAPSGARPTRDAEQSIVMSDSTASSFGEQGADRADGRHRQQSAGHARRRHLRVRCIRHAPG